MFSIVFATHEQAGMSQSFKQECDFANDMQAYICLMPQGFQAEITREEL